jgi:hypothetical protein
MSEPSQPSKIIVDEDWKSQVQAEKQRLAEEEARKQGESHRAATAPAHAGEDAQLPPASFPMLVSMLATQAMVCLGQIPDPLADKVELHLDQAKHFIDLLQMLEEKTKGNLAPNEAAMLEGLLHELRMAFVSVSTPHSGQQAPDRGL